MSRAPLWLGGAIGLFAVAAGTYWCAAPESLTADRHAQRTQAPVADRGTRVTPQPTARPTTASLEAAVLRSALTARFRGLDAPRRPLEALFAGDVAGGARALLQARHPGAAAAAAELAALCRELDEPAGDAALRSADARARLAASRDAAAATTLEALIDAERNARARLRAGCAIAAFDPAANDRRLSETALAGDAASLERLAAGGALPITRLQSAAVLGSPRAAFRLGLDRLQDEPLVARTWLEAAARGDPDAEAFYGNCLLVGCVGAPDPAAGRAALESAARRGALYALGLLAGSAPADPPNRWSPADVLLAPVPPRATEAPGDAADRYAWSSLAGELAAAGCFGFELSIAAEALGARGRLERTWPPSELAIARRRAERLADTEGGAIRHARGCD